MKYSQIIAKIEEIAPLSNASAWDNSGLQFVVDKEEINKLAVCLDPSPVNIQKAILAKADMLLTHHPLALEPKYLNVIDDHYQAIKFLMQANMPLYSAHTSLDVCSFAFWLAEELQLTNCQVLEPSAVDTHGNVIGFGSVGDLPTPLSVSELQKQLRPFFAHSILRYAGLIPKKIERVAFCGGSGASLIEYVKTLRADIYISGDFKYHSTENLVAHTASQKSLLLLDAGHFALEEEMIKRFSQYLQKQMPELEVNFIPSQDPFYTFI